MLSDSTSPERTRPRDAWRVERNSDAAIKAARDAGIRDSLRYHAARPGEIPARLAELDREWDSIARSRPAPGR